jgi:hypothetical protein
MFESGFRSLRRVLSRRLLALGLLAVMVSGPTVVLASHTFTDVPNTNTFHTNIANIAGAGITTGCGATTYCPDAFVTREQMAAFLNRTGSRMSITYFSTPLGSTPGAQPANNAVVATTPVRTIGHEILLITAHFFAFTYAGSGTYPCEVVYRFRVNGVLVGSAAMYDRSIVVPANTWTTTTISGQYAITVSPGDHTVSMTYQRITNGCSSYPGSGTLVVQNVPFSWNMQTVGPGAAAGPGDATRELDGSPNMQSNGAPLD